MSPVSGTRPPSATRQVPGTVLVARLDNDGDVLLTGPAIRAVAARARRVVLLAGPRGRQAATLLPGVDEVITWRAPWIDPEPEPVDRAEVDRLVAELAATGAGEAIVFTSFHQSPLPLALLLRLAGVPRVSAISVDYPGSLLDVRHHVDDDIPEPERALSLAAAAGYRLPDGDDGRLAVRRPLPDTSRLTGPGGYVVLHPGVTAPARAWPAERFAQSARALAARGHRVVVTGAPGERDLTSVVTAGARQGDAELPGVLDLGGATSLPELADVLARASVVVVANTGPAHLAAAVGTPVVSLFAPVVPSVRWAPYGVPHVLLGDQGAPCRGTRARVCPVPGHPCLTSVTVADVVGAVDSFVGVAA